MKTQTDEQKLKHSPLPWNVNSNKTSVFGKEIGDLVCTTYSSVSNDEAFKRMQANAEHIVNCVNSHDELTRQNKIMREALKWYQSKDDLWCYNYEEFSNDLQALYDDSGKIATEALKSCGKKGEK